MDIVGAIDDDPAKKETYIPGVRILGYVSDKMVPLMETSPNGSV